MADGTPGRPQEFAVGVPRPSDLCGHRG